MTFLTLEFSDQQAARAAYDQLWQKHKVTGEIGLYRMEQHLWYLELVSEKELAASALEKLGGKAL